MSASAIPSHVGLVFSISPAKKQARKPDKDEEIYMLILAPFNKAPKINLGQVKLNDTVEKSLLIVNPQDFTVKLNIKNTDLNINNLEVEIERQANIDFKIKWQPNKVDIYKFSIIFEVLNSRLKFIVHAFGTCIEPPKKKVYKNLTILQPIRPVVKPQPLKSEPVIEVTLKKPSLQVKQDDKSENNKENQSDQKSKKAKTITKTKSIVTTQQCIETTYIVENTVEQFEKILEHVKEETYETQKNAIDLQRRQTEIIKTPKFNSHFNFNFDEKTIEESGSYGNLNSIYSATVSNLNDTVNLLKTPIFKEPSKTLRRSISATNLNKLNDIDEISEYGHKDDFEITMTPKIKLDFDEFEFKRRSNEEQKIQLETKLLEIKRKYAAIKIQNAFMIYKKRKNEKRLAYEREIKIKIQQIRVKYASIKIQKAYKNYKKRSIEKKIKKFREQKAASKIQKYWRLYAEQKRKINAINLIKRTWHRYKFRKSLSYYRNAAIKIQKWSRAMKERYYYLRFKRVLIYVQQYYKRRYRIRTLAALKIQRFYHSYKYRMFEHDRMLRLNYAATLIQSLWRGYKTRKEINLIQLRNIRERLSVYIQRPQLNAHLTLGNRIKRSLNVLEQKSPSIQQIITALMDLQVVTRLSKECCIIFANSGAISILYEFITRCNRSTPHMDLIKLCLEILINLSKCENTCEFIVLFEQQNEVCVENNNISSNALNILLGLLQAYQTSNPQIFMYVCVLFIILASNERLVLFKEAVLQQNYLKKLLQLHAALERRTNFRMKNQRLSVIPANNNNNINVNTQEFLNETLNLTAISNVTTSTAISSTNTVNSTASNASSTVSNFNQANLLFTIEPDWSLSKKLFIQLSEPMGALQYLLVNTLKMKVESSIDSAPGSLRTPKKSTSSTNSLSSSTKKTQLHSADAIQQPNSAKNKQLVAQVARKQQ